MDLQELSDRQEITDLITRYTRAVDTGQYADLTGVFTDDAVLDYSPAGGPVGPPSEVVPWIEQGLAGFERVQHVIGQVSITLDGDGTDRGGRRSGRALTTPLLFLRDGDDVVVVASSGGMDAMPQWYGNLRAQPDTTVQVGREAWPVRARMATPEEKKALWPRLVDVYADFASYQQWTDREIPVVICEPRSDA